MNTDRFFQLYPHAIPVTGQRQGAIYDVHQGRIIPVPKALCSILTDLKQSSVHSVKQKYSLSQPELLDTYLRFLQEKEVGHHSHQPMHYPALDMTWTSPCHIQSAVIDYHFSHYSLVEVLEQLNFLLCRSLELRFTVTSDTLTDLSQILEALNGKVFRSVDIVINYHPGLFENNVLEDLYQRSPKINRILVDQAPWTQKPVPGSIPMALTSDNTRQVRPRRRYVVNLPYFTEAQHHNPYYNRKVCIDAAGKVKNCLLLEPSFGSIPNDTLASITQQRDFRSLWFASPDKITDLCQSELRYAAFLCEALEWDANSAMYQIRHDHTPVVSSEKSVLQLPVEQ